MSFRHDYIMDQVEKIAQLIASLISNQSKDKIEEIDCALSEVTGLGKEIFRQNDVILVSALIQLLQDADKKALACILLQKKAPESYRALYETVLKEIDTSQLNPKTRELLRLTNSN